MKKAKRFNDGGMSLEEMYPEAKITRAGPQPPPVEGGKGSEQHIRNLEALRFKRGSANAKPELFIEPKMERVVDKEIGKVKMMPALLPEELRNIKGASRPIKGGGGGGGGMGTGKMNRDITKNYCSGGSVSSASKRADGIAIRGKTKA